MSRLTFHLIPHTHWDREWYRTRGGFGARLVLMLDALVDYLESTPEVPGFVLDGQTVLLEDYLAVRPDQRDRVRRLVDAGRLEAGPWYVLADEQIPAGESLIRNLLLGQADGRSLGRTMPVLYSPDAFGHPAWLPALAAEFGIRVGMSWRGFDRGRDVVEWVAPDGRSMILYHLPPDGYETGAALSSDPEVLARQWPPLRRLLVERAATRHIAIPVGADHHFARTDFALLRNALARLEPEADVILSTGSRYALALEGSGASLENRTGEQRHSSHTWSLQDVHGTRSHLKRANSRLELLLLRCAEPLAALAGARGGPVLRPLLDAAWRQLVQCHFHDSLAGTCHDDVARAMVSCFAEVRDAAREITLAAAGAIWDVNPDRARETSDGEPALLVWNPAPRARSQVVLGTATFFRGDILVGPPGDRKGRTGDGYRPFALQGPDGKLHPVQVLQRTMGTERLEARRHYPDQDLVDLVRFAVRVPAVDGMAGAILRPVGSELQVESGAAYARGRVLQNDRLRVQVERDGTLQVLERETNTTWRRQLQLVSETDAGDTYTFVRPAGSRSTSASRVDVIPIAAGPLVAGLLLRGQVPGPSRTRDRIEFRLLLTLLDDDAFLRCTLFLNNRARDHRLRFRLGAGEPVAQVLAGGPLGVVRRAVDADAAVTASIETWHRTAPAHRFVASGVERPVAIFAPGFFQYEAAPDGDLWFTVLRAVGELSRGDLPTRPGHAGWPTPTPDAQCPGADRLDFALGFGGAARPDPVTLERSWEDLFVPLAPGWWRQWNGHVRQDVKLELEGRGLVLSALYPAREGQALLLRCYNVADAAEEGRIRPGFRVRRAVQCRADETEIAELEREADGSVKVRVPARGQFTVRLEVAD